MNSGVAVKYGNDSSAELSEVRNCQGPELAWVLVPGLPASTPVFPHPTPCDPNLEAALLEIDRFSGSCFNLCYSGSDLNWLDISL